MQPAGNVLGTRDDRQVLAAVDLGSNSFHMIVARYEHGQLTVIDRIREMVRLAAGFDDKGRIGTAASRRALDCIQRFGQRLRDMQAANVRAVGTNALRKAKNSQDFLQQAEEALGHPIEIVSGREEARLVYLGAAHSLSSQQEQRLVVDIGGGSTELIVGREFEPRKLFSLYMGCVGLTEEYFPSDKITAKRWRRARLAADMELEPVRADLKDMGWDDAVGTSGTIRAARAVLRNHGWAEDITSDGLRELEKFILAGGSDRLSELNGLSSERAPVFAGGVVILQSVMEGLGIERMRAARGALREGLIYDMIGRMGSEDARNRSVRSLERRYHVDTGQAERVEQTAAVLLDSVGRDWRIDDELSKKLLSWAAHLHEIGLGIAHAQYHRHGSYLLEHSDLDGFSNREKSLLATLVLVHRRKIPASSIAQLPAPWNERVAALAVLLRLSVLFHRSRTSAALPVIKLKADKRALRLSIPAGWLDDHPLTLADLKREMRYLEAIDYKLKIDPVKDSKA